MVLLADPGARTDPPLLGAPFRVARGRGLAVGDVVVLYERGDRVRELTLTPGGQHQNHCGVFHHDVREGK